jgi:hypothetical protein
VLLKACGSCPRTVVQAVFLSWKHERLHCRLRQRLLEVTMARWSQRCFDLEIDLVSKIPRHAFCHLARDSGRGLVFRSGLFAHPLRRGRAHDYPNLSLASLPSTGSEV